MCVDIPLLPDSVIEEVEALSVELSSNDADVTILRQSAIIDIQDESTATVQFTIPVFPVREEDGAVEICAELIGGTLERSVEVNFATQSSTATGMLSLSESHDLCDIRTSV